MRTFSIAGRPVGPGAPCFVIAEAGVNHNGDAALALRLVDAAAAAHADAVKFQTFRAEAVAAAEAPKAAYQQASTGGAESQLDMLRRLELSTDGHHAVVERCRDRGILFLSTPFDEQSADFLDAMGVPAFKIPSGELTNAALVSHVARKGRPMIVSTGMATLGEVDEAIRTIAASGNPPVALLQCVTNYPADPATANLRAMHAMAAAFDVPTGYSDHTRGVETALAAVALGACIVEKHFTLDRLLPGPDHAASLEPGELAQLIAGIRVVESALGHGRKEPNPSEAANAAVARRRVVAARDIAAGERIAPGDVALRRAGSGVAAAQRELVVGRTAARAIAAGSGITWEALA